MLGKAEFRAQFGTRGRVVGDGLVAALRQNKGPVGRLRAQQCQHFVAHKGGGEKRKPRLKRRPGPSKQVLFANDARQFMHQHNRVDAGVANQRQNVTCGRGVDDGVGESQFGQGFQLDAQGRLGRRDRQRAQPVGRRLSSLPPSSNKNWMSTPKLRRRARP